jgi:hypothetical protein
VMPHIALAPSSASLGRTPDRRDASVVR